MNKEIKNKIKKNVPNFVFDNLYEECTSEAIGRVIDTYLGDDNEKVNNFK